MNEYLNEIYMSAANVGFLVALYRSAGRKHWPTALAGTALVLIAATDAFTWSLPGVPVHHPFGLFGLLDIVGVFGALGAIYLVASPLNRIVALRWSIGAAIMYILNCLIFWILYPESSSTTYRQFLDATGLQGGSGKLFAVLFVAVALCLGAFLWLSFRFPGDSAAIAWRAYAIGTWAYLICYFLLMTRPIINHTWTPHRVGEKPGAHIKAAP